MSMKILIADPDSRFAAQAASYLESKAHLVAHYGDAASALIAARGGSRTWSSWPRNL